MPFLPKRQKLDTCDDGLTSKEAESRIGQYGLNVIEKGQAISRWIILLRQIKRIYRACWQISEEDKDARGCVSSPIYYQMIDKDSITR